MPEEVKLPAHKGPKERKSGGLYKVARVLGAGVLNTICPVTYHHRERLQADAPFIVICNHLSWLDPVVVAYPIRRYETTFVGKKELVKNALMRRITLGLHMIVVDRHNSDMAAMRACMKELRDGGVLGIFPEGTRHHHGVMEETEAGVGLIALRCNVPIIPIYLTGRVRPFHHVHAWVGETIEYSDLREQGINAETAAQLMLRIRDTYRKMQEEAR